MKRINRGCVEGSGVGMPAAQRWPVTRSSVLWHVVPHGPESTGQTDRRVLRTVPTNARNEVPAGGWGRDPTRFSSIEAAAGHGGSVMEFRAASSRRCCAGDDDKLRSDSSLTVVSSLSTSVGTAWLTGLPREGTSQATMSVAGSRFGALAWLPPAHRRWSPRPFLARSAKCQPPG